MIPAGLIKTFEFTLLQSSLSAACSLVFGFFGFLGLCSLSTKRAKHFLSLMALLPNVLPVLFVIIATLNMVEMMKGNLLGLWGIVILHSLINVGLVALGLYSGVESKFGGLLEFCWLAGARKWQVFKQVIILLKADLASLFFFVFSFCFVSFAVPLVLGGGFQRSLEVFIYEEIRIKGDLVSSLLLTLLQAFMLFLFSRLFWTKKPIEVLESRNLKIISWSPGILAIVAPALVVVIGLAAPTMNLYWLKDFKLIFGDVLSVLPQTLFVGLFTGAIVFVAFCILGWFYPCRFMQHLLFSISAPSMVVLGFLLFIFGPKGEWISLLKIGFGLGLAFVPALYKLYLATDFKRLFRQYEVANTLGVKRGMFFRSVIYPQINNQILQAARLAGLWAVGDFALSAIVAPSSITLPLVIKDLLQSYRLDLATVYCWVLLIVGIVVYLLLGVFGRVFSAKFDQRVL